jgi:hypothetical protein
MARPPETNRKNHYGWYVVLDSDQCVVYAAGYANHIHRDIIETRVAKHLVPGTFWGCGVSQREALEQAMTRYLSFYKPQGEQDVSTDTQAGRKAADRRERHHPYHQD